MSKYIKKDENGFYVFDEIEFSKTLPTGLEYFAVDKETEQIYNLGFNYKEKMEKQISDLEAKLAEYKKFMKDNEWDSVDEMQETLNKCEKKYFDIQQELAGRKKLCDLRYKQLQNSHQDKISFCIEKLEKVKELMRNIDMPDKPELYNNDMFGAGFDSHYIRVEKLIDNQIKQLKEGK